MLDFLIIAAWIMWCTHFSQHCRMLIFDEIDLFSFIGVFSHWIGHQYFWGSSSSFLLFSISVFSLFKRVIQYLHNALQNYYHSSSESRRNCFYQWGIGAMLLIWVGDFYNGLKSALRRVLRNGCWIVWLSSSRFPFDRFFNFEVTRKRTELHLDYIFVLR